MKNEAEEFLKKFKSVFDNFFSDKSVNCDLQKDLELYVNKFIQNQERWSIVNKITRQITSSIVSSSMYKIVITELKDMLNITFCGICVYDENCRKFILNYKDSSGEALAYLQAHIEYCNRKLENAEFSLEAILKLFTGNLKEYFYSIPLINKNQFLGAIYVYNKDCPVDEESKDILTLVADNIAFAIMNANLYSILEQKDKDKLEFIASMSHEFKNPLNTIIGFTNLLRDGAIEDKETAMRYLNNIIISSHHMSNLVADIIEMARGESGEIELAYEEFSPKGVILEVLSMHESELMNKNINLKTSLNDYPIFADTKRFRQVIYNLISNAIKFVKNNGLIEIVTFCKNGWFNFEITDNGEGIGEEHKGKLFKFFSQGSDSFAKRREGYGVGLAVCKKVIDSHKGEINFDSEKGKGSTFRFKLPVKKAAVEMKDVQKENPQAGMNIENGKV